MSRTVQKVQIRWVCDRCHHVEVTDEDRLPQDWGRPFGLTQGYADGLRQLRAPSGGWYEVWDLSPRLRSDFSDALTETITLCDSCVPTFTKWLLKPYNDRASVPVPETTDDGE